MPLHQRADPPTEQSAGTTSQDISSPPEEGPTPPILPLIATTPLAKDDTPVQALRQLRVHTGASIFKGGARVYLVLLDS